MSIFNSMYKVHCSTDLKCGHNVKSEM